MAVSAGSFDLIIIGTGFASTFFLKKYLEKTSSNKKVLVLEKGQHYLHSQRLDLHKANKPISGNLWEASNSYTTNSKEKSWHFDQNFGGSSNCWTGCTPRFLPNDFRLRSLYGVGTDWPISYEQLDPYYEEAELTMMIAGPEDTPFPRRSPYPLQAHTLGTFDMEIKKRYPQEWISQPTARASRSLPTRNACCGSASCTLCPANAKFTIENHFADLYGADRITVSYESQVTELELKNDQVTKVKFIREGIEHEASGDFFALGANGIFNPYLLIKSGDKNRSTGKGITEQAGAFVHLYLKDLSNVGGSTIITSNGYMLYDTPERKDRAACIIENFNDTFIRNEPGKWRHMAKLKFIYEDIPNDNNYVTVSKDTDKPLIHFVGRSDYTLKAFSKLNEDVERIFSFLPIERIECDDYFQQTEFHICSTTRMSETPETGVVDKNLLHHQYRNLAVLGSGAFPTVTPANPSLTISALSLRSADNLF